MTEDLKIVEPFTPEEVAVIEKWKKTNQAMIPLTELVLCENCKVASAANGETCPNCHAVGSLGSVARMLAPKLEPCEFNDVKIFCSFCNLDITNLPPQMNARHIMGECEI